MTEFSKPGGRDRHERELVVSALRGVEPRTSGQALASRRLPELWALPPALPLYRGRMRVSAFFERSASSQDNRDSAGLGEEEHLDGYHWSRELVTAYAPIVTEP